MGALMVLNLGIAFVFGHVAMDSTESGTTAKFGALATLFTFFAVLAAENL